VTTSKSVRSPVVHRSGAILAAGRPRGVIVPAREQQSLYGHAKLLPGRPGPCAGAPGIVAFLLSVSLRHCVPGVTERSSVINGYVFRRIFHGVGPLPQE
jgi:hypothetical protein